MQRHIGVGSRKPLYGNYKKKITVGTQIKRKKIKACHYKSITESQMKTSREEERNKRTTKQR